LVNLCLDLVHLGGSIRLHLSPLALGLIRRLLGPLLDIHEAQVGVDLSLVNALL
jgi:hypothetical protein